LTRREQDVLRLLVQHKTDREIAEALYLSARTVNWHVRSILGKLGFATRRELIALTRAETSKP
jgi:DNA-binding CsgD family transcriptional regulator